MKARKVGKQYLGDAVYARLDDFGGLILTTENGVETTNEIYLEPRVLEALLQFVRVEAERQKNGRFPA